MDRLSVAGEQLEQLSCNLKSFFLKKEEKKRKIEEFLRLLYMGHSINCLQYKIGPNSK